MDALASPMAAQATKPPLMTTCGRTPKNAGFHSTRSASLPGSTEPIWPSSPCAIAGPIVFPLSLAWALRHLPGLPGLPLLIAAGLLAVALLLALRFARTEPGADSAREMPN